MRNKRGFAPVLIILVIGIIIIAAVLVFGRNKLVKVSAPVPTVTSDPTQSWNTYTNKLLDYSLQFPSSYQLADNNTNDIIFGYQSVMTARNGTVLKNVPYLEISSTYKTDFSKLTPCPEEGGVHPCIIGSYATNGSEIISNIKVGGRVASSVFLEDPDAPNTIVIQVSNPKLEITFFNISPYSGQISDQILSTFKFTN